MSAPRGSCVLRAIPPFKKCMRKTENAMPMEFLNGNGKDWQSDAVNRKLVIVYRQGLSEQSSSPDERISIKVWEILASMTVPINVAKAGNQLRLLANGAKGLNDMSRSALSCVPHEELAAHFNILLLSSCPLSSFREAYISLIPKAGDSSKPENYRSIHGWTSAAPNFGTQTGGHACLPRQKAFRLRDGIHGNTMLPWFETDSSNITWRIWPSKTCPKRSIQFPANRCSWHCTVWVCLISFYGILAIYISATPRAWKLMAVLAQELVPVAVSVKEIQCLL